MILLAICLSFIIALLLIAFAIHKRDCVRASFNFRSAGFSLEAKNNEPKSPTLPS
jgi:hypothetical protein